MSENKRTLVFGGTGFIGGHVARYFQSQGDEVWVFKRPETKPVGLEGISFKHGDLNQLDQIKQAAKGFGRIIFCAGYYPLLSFKIETQIEFALAQLRNFFSAIEPQSDFVFVSSFTTIGDAIDGTLADERCEFDLLKHPGGYFRIKYELEKEVIKQAPLRSGRTIIVNPSAIFGDYDIKPTTSRVVIDVAKGRVPFRVHGPLNAVDIHDVARGIFLALEKGRSGERYILGGENTTIQWLIETICEITGARKPFIPISFSMMRVAARASEEIHRLLKLSGPPLIPVVGVDLLENSKHVSSQKAQRELGYEFHDVRPALERAYRWFIENKYL